MTVHAIRQSVTDIMNRRCLCRGTHDGDTPCKANYSPHCTVGGIIRLNMQIRGRVAVEVEVDQRSQIKSAMPGGRWWMVDCGWWMVEGGWWRWMVDGG